MDDRRPCDGTALAAILFGTAAAVAVTAFAADATRTDPASGRAELGSARSAATAVDRASERASPSGGVAFYASSLDEWWSVSGDYGGRLERVGNDLIVRVPTARLRFHNWDDPVPSRLTGIRLALAEPGNAAWRVAVRGEVHEVSIPLTPGRDVRLRDLTLRIADVAPHELDGRWLVVVHEVTTPTAAGSSASATYAHADEALLARLMGWMPAG